MSQFKNSSFAKLASRSMILALVWNFLSLVVFAPRAEAQFVSTTTQWAVLDFVNKSKLGGDALGGAAADAVATMFMGTNRYDILPRETVERAYKELELTPPLTRDLEVLRVAQELKVETVIVGEITDARINKGAQGKSADVALLVRGLDTASGLPVMGAAVHGQSSERPGDVSDEVVLSEAVNFAAQQAVTEILTKQVDVATVLTTPTNQFVTLNKGSRNGLKVGMEMVVTRGREQVATIRVAEVSPDMATGRVIKSFKGVAPADKARALATNLPKVVLTRGGGARVRSARTGGGASTAALALLVVGLLALTIQDGGGDTTPGNLTTEASLAEDGISPVVKASWKPNLFNLGVSNRVEWHLWRADYQPTPVEVVNGTVSSVLDRTAARVRNWRDMGTVVGGTECVDDPGVEAFDQPAPGVVPGTTYMYQLSLVYKISSLDLPGGGGTGEPMDCFFQTSRKTARGSATPLAPVSLSTPPNGATDVGNVVQFSWESAAGADQYLVQLSTTPNFRTRSSVRNIAVVNTILQGGVSTDPIDISGHFSGVQRLYWRVGAKNTGDLPGPTKDATGERYVFSRPFQFDRVIPPPPPPGA